MVVNGVFDFTLTLLTIMMMVVFSSTEYVRYEDYEDEDAPLSPRSRFNPPCERMRSIQNGWVKIRSRGRIAKFNCNPGYQILGSRFVVCVMRQWNNPKPVCAKRGCSTPDNVPNSFSKTVVRYRGAVVEYECTPGYIMSGAKFIYCDGKSWNTIDLENVEGQVMDTRYPTCTAKANPERSCNFESENNCGWTQDPTHSRDWKKTTLSTPSGQSGTGPSSDHTLGEGMFGSYLYIEASEPSKVNDTSRIFSPVFPSSFSNACFEFWYHMYGEGIGSLRIYTKTEPEKFEELIPSLVISGEQGNAWIQKFLTIPQFMSNFQIVIEGVRGKNFLGDIAIDDVNLHQNSCEHDFSSDYYDMHESISSIAEETTTLGYFDETTKTDKQQNDNKDHTTVTEMTTNIDRTTRNTTMDDSDEKWLVTRWPFDLTQHNTFFDESSSATPLTNASSVSESYQTQASSTLTVSKFTSSKSSSTLPTRSTAKIRSTARPTVPNVRVTKISTIGTKRPTSTMSSPTQDSTRFRTSHATTTQYMSTRLRTSRVAALTTPIPENSRATMSTTEQTSRPTTMFSSSTRKTYNLRPRTTTATSVTQTPLKSSTQFTQSTPIISSEYAKIYETTSTVLQSTTIDQSTSKFSDQSTNYVRPYIVDSTTVPSTPSSSSIVTLGTTHRPTTSTVKLTTKILPTAKFGGRSTSPRPTTPSTVRTTHEKLTTITTRTSLKPLLDPGTAAPHISIEKSSGQGGYVAITTAIIVLVICGISGLIYYLKKRKDFMRRKFADDSEMTYLHENEVLEHNDSSAMDRILQ